MKKLFTILSMLVMMNPGVVGASADGADDNWGAVSPLVLAAVLEMPEADFIADKDAFVQNCISSDSIDLYTIAVACLDTVGTTSVENIEHCRDLVDEVYKFHNGVVEAFNSGLVRYAWEGIQPDLSTKSAEAYDGQYYLAKMQLPEYVDLSMFTEDGADVYRHQEMVFDADNNFICAGNYDAMDLSCKQEPDSDVIFYTAEQDARSIRRLFTISAAQAEREWDESRRNSIGIGYDNVKLFDKLGDYGSEISRFFKYIANEAGLAESFSKAELAIDHVSVEGEAAEKCKDSHGLHVGDRRLFKYTTECDDDKCMVTVQYAGLSYTCTFGPNWEEDWEEDRTLHIDSKIERASEWCRGELNMPGACVKRTLCENDKCYVSLGLCDDDNSLSYHRLCEFGPNWELELAQPIDEQDPEWGVAFRGQAKVEGGTDMD